MALLPVEAALARIVGAARLLVAEDVALQNCAGRVLARNEVARLTQPPFDASAMDGYAVASRDARSAPVTLRVWGQSAAGAGSPRPLGAGEAVRIFTGAPVPPGADAVVIQENVTREGDHIQLSAPVAAGDNIRPRGGDFCEGGLVLAAGCVLRPRALMHAAAAGYSSLCVRRKPRVAILATGNELVAPGVMPGPDQIVSSNPVGLAALVAQFGGEPVMLGIAGDTLDAISAKARDATGADILVTTGGVSVGDHDLVGAALASLGMSLDFWKIAMRPGKPLMVGTLGAQRVLGLPGNPVSALVTARLFLVPLMRAMLGDTSEDRPQLAATLTDLPANGPRQHYMRGKLSAGDTGLRVAPLGSQDSSMLSVFSAADALIIRPIDAPAAAKGTLVPVLPLDF